MQILVTRQNDAGKPLKPPPGETIDFDHPYSAGYQVIAAGIALIVLSFFFVVVKLWVKKRYTKGLGWDDLLISFAWVFAVARSICFCIDAEYYSLGVHVWDVRVKVVGDMQKNLLFIGDMLYLLGIMCAKLSILLLYYKIFRVNRKFRILCYLTMAFVVVYCIMFFLLYAVGCNPPAAAWHFLTWQGPPPTCINNIAVNFAIGGFNIGTDLWIMVLPLPLLTTLHLDRKQRFGLIAIFATGAFVIAAAIVREVIVVETLRDKDQTYVVVPEIIWLTVELNVGIICATLPALAPIYSSKVLGKIIPQSLRDLLSRSRGSNSSGASSQKHSRLHSSGAASAAHGRSRKPISETQHMYKNSADSGSDDIELGEGNRQLAPSEIHRRIDVNVERQCSCGARNGTGTAY